jgi:hypothetical protein
MHAVWRRFIGAALVTTLATMVFAQPLAPPSHSRQHRTALQAFVRAVDTRSAGVDIAEADWPLHVLRASDGSHYVAFSLNRVEGLALGRATVVYVRLATRRAANDSGPVERSVVAEWLAGQTPVPALPQRGIAFGEMPTYGAGGIAARGASTVAQNLQILELERERARAKREEQERTRKAALEGADTARAARPLLPFEDFDVNAQAVADSTGAAVLRRSVVAGPGEYELIVAWLDPAGGSTTPVRVARRALTLPPATSTGLALSSVILADDVAVRETPIPATEQARHPYSIGATEITPARDHVLTPDERLALVVQIINARGGQTGKPDVQVGFRVFRRNAAREENVGSLAPQSYNELTLPIDFDVTKGHPIFAAVAVPLRNFKRGDYRMEITAHDRIAGTGVVTDVAFTVAATPAALLREAPPLAPSFDPAREGVAAAVPVMLGAIRASEGQDREAIAAWQTALDNGADRLVVWPLMIDASLRLSDTSRAIALATQALEAAPEHPRFSRQLARAMVMAGRADEALRVLDTHLQRAPDDVEAQWIALHALYAGFVSGSGAGASTQGRSRLVALAERYVAAGGPYAALAADWAASVR